MSRIGKQPVSIQSGVVAEIDKYTVKVKGPKGELVFQIPREIRVEQSESELIVKPTRDSRRAMELWGLWRSLIANAVRGVSEGYQIELRMVGVGYHAQKKGSDLELEVGFSHKVPVAPPEGIDFEIEKDVIRIKGIDKQLVGQVAANIRKVRPPEPYKGKGIRYIDEVVHLKPGKAAKAAGAV